MFWVALNSRQYVNENEPGRSFFHTTAVAHLIAASIRRAGASTSFISGDVVSLQLAYKESTGGLGQLMTESSRNTRLVPCFPLHALLVALNQSTVDYLSLDVEGLELEVRSERESERIYLPSQIMTQKGNITQFTAAGCQRKMCLSMLAACDKIKIDMINITK